ncbi:MAG: histone deacetylase [Anaerolineales bacterium]
MLPLPPGHRFPMRKYAALRERILAERLVPPDDLRVPDPATDADLLRVHAPEYVAAVTSGTLDRKAQRKIGFPWSPGMVERSRRSVGATMAAARSALAEGLAANLAGGTHHAHYASGGGFCVFNDAVVALRALQAEGRITQALILDADVHQGDGTAALCHDDPSIFTLSIHGAKNYPFHKPPSDLDIGLPDGAGDAVYLDALQTGVSQAFAAITPDIVIYLAGADPYEKDKLGRLALSKDGLRARDVFVLDACRAHGVPVALVMAGGYAPDVDDIVDIHFMTLALAQARMV